MSNKKIILVIGAVVIALAGGVGIGMLLKDNPEPQQQVATQDEYLTEKDLPQEQPQEPQYSTNNDLEKAEVIIQDLLDEASVASGFYDYSIETDVEGNLIVVIIHYSENDLYLTSDAEWDTISETFRSVTEDWYDYLQDMGIDVNVGITMGDIVTDYQYYGAANGQILFDYPNGIY